ncbi:MAG: hypothetical protein ABI623_03640, partial [bacterium]
MRKLIVLPAVAVLLVMTVASASFVRSQDMAKVAPKFVKVVLDNDKVRVYEVTAKAGDKLPMHSHPSSSMVIPITAGKTRTTLADGKVSDTEFKVG